MSEGGPRVLLYVTADPAGRERLVAAIERDARGELWFVPDPAQVAASDPRGRRTTLGSLLRAHAGSGPEDLADLAAHLVPLPQLELDRPATEPRPAALEVRLVGIDSSGLAERWSAPSGREVAVERAPLRLGPGRSAALLASAGAPGGPWLRPLEPIKTEARMLLELVAEAGVPLVQEQTYVERWLERLSTHRSELDPATRQALVSGFREAIRSALLHGVAPPAEVAGAVLRVEAEPATDFVRWRLSLRLGPLEEQAELETARFAADTIADLLAVLEGPLQPYWLLLFEERDGLGPYLAGVVDVRRFLSENLDRLEDRP
ncbi:MAG: hypothetical protein AAFZ65_16320 [Planctomycetota bacterium]